MLGWSPTVLGYAAQGNTFFNPMQSIWSLVELHYRPLLATFVLIDIAKIASTHLLSLDQQIKKIFDN